MLNILKIGRNTKITLPEWYGVEIAVGRCIVSDIRIIIKRWRKLECITRVPPKIMLKIIVIRK